MMRFQPVPADLIGRSLVFGLQVVARYGKEGRSAASKARSGERGSDRDPLLQTRGKIGEIALALTLGLDPEKAVKWDVAIPDKGHDVVTPNGYRVDVKTTFTPYKLIWSNTVNDLYEKKEFDVICAVNIDQQKYTDCWIAGIVSKAKFLRDKQVANGQDVGPGLEPGTWFVDKSTLADLDVLLNAPPIIRPDPSVEHECWCGKRGSFGENVRLLQGKPGVWYCAEHNPENPHAAR